MSKSKDQDLNSWAKILVGLAAITGVAAAGMGHISQVPTPAPTPSCVIHVPVTSETGDMT
jgi:hypothetical protein